MPSNPLFGCLGLVLVLLPNLSACTRVPQESPAPASSPAPAPAPPPAASAPAGTEPVATAAPVAGVRSTAMATGHVTLTGSYAADAEAEATCAPAEDSLQITLLAQGAPRVVLRLDGLAAKGTSGTYSGKVSVIASDLGEGGFRLSEGKAKAEITVDPAAPGSAGGPRRVSGSFRTSYAGEGGKGTVAGRFESCAYKPEQP